VIEDGLTVRESVGSVEAAEEPAAAMSETAARAAKRDENMTPFS
jgi:hypothetical protein